jgi:hypothetical protein
MRVLLLTSLLALATMGPAQRVVGAEAIEGMCLLVREPAADGRAIPAAAHSILACRVHKGTHRNVPLDDLAVVALAAPPPKDDPHAGPQTQLLVDARADAAQQAALVDLCQSLAGKAMGRIRSTELRKIDLRIGEGCAMGYACLTAGDVVVRTRRLQHAEQQRADADWAERAPLANVHDPQCAVVTECAESASFPGGRAPKFASDHCPNAMVGRFAR